MSILRNNDRQKGILNGYRLDSPNGPQNTVYRHDDHYNRNRPYIIIANSEKKYANIQKIAKKATKGDSENPMFA